MTKPISFLCCNEINSDIIPQPGQRILNHLKFQTNFNSLSIKEKNQASKTQTFESLPSSWSNSYLVEGSSLAMHSVIELDEIFPLP